MSLFTLVRTNLTLSSRVTINVFVSYILYGFMSLFLVGAILVPFYFPGEGDHGAGPVVFISSLLFYDYFVVQAKLRSRSLIDKFTFALFPVSRARSLSIRFVLFLADKRILFYFLPMLGTLIVLAARGRLMEMSLMIFLFSSMYLATSEFFFLIYAILRRIADRFSVRTATQFSAVPLLLFLLAINGSSHGETGAILIVPVVAQFTKGFHDILSSRPVAALSEIGYLVVIFLSFAIIMTSVGWLLEKWIRRSQFSLRFMIDEGMEPKTSPLGFEPHRTTWLQTGLGEDTRHDMPTPWTAATVPASKLGWHLVFVDWLVHQREEKILYLLLLYPLMVIFGIIQMTPRLHFELGSLILPIFLLTQILGFYFTENHFTAHGLRLSHVMLTPLDPFRFVFSKSVSTWGLLSLMNVFVCLFCGVYLKMTFDSLAHGTIYSFYLPLVLLQLASTLNLYFPGVSRHPMVSLFIIITTEILLTAIYVLLMLFSFVSGILFVGTIFYLSYWFSLPAWGRQLSRQLQILIEHQK